MSLGKTIGHKRNLSSIDDRSNGQVMNSRLILKAEHYGDVRPKTSSSSESFDLPFDTSNWRTTTDGNICGTAQPSVIGIKTILRMLGCGPGSKRTCLWISAREEPILYIEHRPFVLREASNPFTNMKTYAGISGTRLEKLEENLSEDIQREGMMNDGIVTIYSETVDQNIKAYKISCSKIQTIRQVFADLKNDGYNVVYTQIPVTRMQSLKEPVFINAYVKEISNSKGPIVFSCGMGIGRTTFGMIIGLLIRGFKEKTSNDSLLRVVRALEMAQFTASATDWLISNPVLKVNLLMAIQGNYHIVTELVRVLPNGPRHKQRVDSAINEAERIVNLREQILVYRIKHLHDNKPETLEMALITLERYLGLIVLAAFLSSDCQQTFTEWLKDHTEVTSVITSLRSRRGQYKPFRPIDDLSSMGVSSSEFQARCDSGQPPADMALTLKNRTGSVLAANNILKLDRWWSASGDQAEPIPGAPNFRQIADWPIFVTAQPSNTAIEHIVAKLGLDKQFLWCNTREEPLVYINGDAYVLRDQYATLRNIKAYAGISASRLEAMEERLKEDVKSEMCLYEEQILVHYERDGMVKAKWIKVESVQTPRELFSHFENAVDYIRIPVTAEDSWEPQDFDRLSEVIQIDQTVVFNCQMGVGRSTMGAVIASQIRLAQSKQLPDLMLPKHEPCEFLSYRIIHSLMRLIPRSLECKRIVDDIIDAAASKINLRECIGEYRELASSSLSDSKTSYVAIRKGVFALKRYVMLILFQAFLIHRAEKSTFTEWLSEHHEILNLLASIDREHGLDSIKPAENFLKPGQGFALTAEVWQVVEGRKGSILGRMTILKDDHFPGCQKAGMEVKIPNAPNLRSVILPNGKRVFGVAMPTEHAIPLVAEFVGNPFI